MDMPVASLPVDRRGRALRDLRISVTDRCNFRCTYCMPKAVFGRDHPFLPKAEILSFEEIVRVTRVMAGLGVGKVRLTGGEPLLRHGIEDLVAMLAEIPGIDLTLTTNGSLLADKAAALRQAGLRRITVSLDALDEATFRHMSDVDVPVQQVLDGIAAAAEAGLSPIKVNMVVKRGTNDHAILSMAERFRGSGHILRFIEYMDVGNSNRWRMDEVLPSRELIDRIAAAWPLEPIGANYDGEVAERWRYRDGSGEIGVISSVTQAFCGSCTRLRLSTEGRLYTCLFASQGHDLRSQLRSDACDADIAAFVRQCWTGRDDHYSELRGEGKPVVHKIEMSYIGG
jgi:cyclic pyranopterin phosphate synthase